MAMPAVVHLSLLLLSLLFFGFASGQMTQQEKDEFLNLHNYYRRQVSPEASDMRRMRWNDVIAAHAQAYADSIDHWDDGHSSNPSRVFDNGEIGPGAIQHGENLAIGYTTPAAVMEGWVVDEIYVSDGSSRSNGGHYTQCVWATTELLGCGARYNIPFVVGTTTYYGRYWICQYGPAGNWGSSPAYTLGASCSACPGGWACDNELCYNPGAQSTTAAALVTTAQQTTALRTTAERTTRERTTREQTTRQQTTQQQTTAMRTTAERTTRESTTAMRTTREQTTQQQQTTTPQQTTAIRTTAEQTTAQQPLQTTAQSPLQTTDQQQQTTDQPQQTTDQAFTTELAVTTEFVAPVDVGNLADDNSGGTSTGTIAGIVVGLLVGILLIIGLIVAVVLIRRRRQENYESTYRSANLALEPMAPPANISSPIVTSSPVVSSPVVSSPVRTAPSAPPATIRTAPPPSVSPPGARLPAPPAHPSTMRSPPPKPSAPIPPIPSSASSPSIGRPASPGPARPGPGSPPRSNVGTNPRPQSPQRSRPLPTPGSQFSIGSTVQSKYSSDGKFYRAVIVDVANGQYLVQYPDYGNEQEWRGVDCLK